MTLDLRNTQEEVGEGGGQSAYQLQGQALKRLAHPRQRMRHAEACEHMADA
jgi:hypothetical protein